MQTLDGDLVTNARNHELAAARDRGAVHREQVTIVNPRVTHARSTHPQQVIGPRAEQTRVDPVTSLDMLAGEDRRPGCHPPHQRQTVARPTAHTDPARSAGQHLDRPLALERTQMILGRIGRTKTECPADIGTSRGHALGIDELLDEFQDFALATGQGKHDHGLCICIG